MRSPLTQPLPLAGERSQTLGRIARQQHHFFAWCVAPSLAVLAIITLLPSLYLLATSFTQLNLTRPETLWDFSQPFESYHQLWDDTRFHNSIWVQIKLSFWTVLLQLGGKTGYMKYRTVPVYPQVGDKINKAIERIATKQQAAPEAMKQAQGEAIQDLQKAGIKVDT